MGPGRPRRSGRHVASETGGGGDPAAAAGEALSASAPPAAVEGGDDPSASLPGSDDSLNKRVLRRLRHKHDPGSFMGDFDPGTSEREKRKTQKKHYGPKGAAGRLYDERGLLLHNSLDLCDCMDADCPGCHFPCHKCRSNKCANECRQHRKWQYETLELDGVPGSLKRNEHLAVPLNKTLTPRT